MEILAIIILVSGILCIIGVFVGKVLEAIAVHKYKKYVVQFWICFFLMLVCMRVMPDFAPIFSIATLIFGIISSWETSKKLFWGIMVCLASQVLICILVFYLIFSGNGAEIFKEIENIGNDVFGRSLSEYSTDINDIDNLPTNYLDDL